MRPAEKKGLWTTETPILILILTMPTTTIPSLKPTATIPTTCAKLRLFKKSKVGYLILMLRTSSQKVYLLTLFETLISQLQLFLIIII
jgi:hypothetical protein